MKKKQVNLILKKQKEKRKKILFYILKIVCVTIISITLFLIYFNKNKEQFVTYNESSNIDYRVYLKENDFFNKEHIGAENQYIASLIKYIIADFNYKLAIDKDNVEYKYSYRMESTVEVKEKDNNNSLYIKTEEILPEREFVSTKSSQEIKEKVNIDYNYYNDYINKFISVYDLNNIESTLTINMYVNVVGACEKIKDHNSEESVTSLSIPLTRKTMAISVSNDLINNNKNVMECKNNYKYNFVFFILGMSLVVVDIFVIVNFIKFMLKTRTAENIYERELKKILNNYGGYIQILENDFNFEQYQILDVNNFNDMLEIRDTVRQPILLKENAKKTGAYFIIPSDTDLLYVYRLNVSNIQKEIEEKFSEVKK